MGRYLITRYNSDAAKNWLRANTSLPMAYSQMRGEKAYAIYTSTRVHTQTHIAAQ